MRGTCNPSPKEFSREIKQVKIVLACRQGTLSSLAIRSVRYGGPGEAALAARVLGLLSLTLGAGNDSER